jgi:hypothetical protein
MSEKACDKTSVDMLLRGVKVRDNMGIPAKAPCLRYLGMLGYVEKRCVVWRASSHLSGTRGVVGCFLLCKTAFLCAVSGIATAGTFIDVASGFVVASDLLIPVAAHTGDKEPFTQWVHVDYIVVTGIK